MNRSQMKRFLRTISLTTVIALIIWFGSGWVDQKLINGESSNARF
jgi:hypothetical protein